MRRRFGCIAATLTPMLLGCPGSNAQGRAHELHEPRDHQHGEVDFPVSCTERAHELVEDGVAMLHHMMYEQARAHFEHASSADPRCAMAHWGVAMTSFQPLWHPTSDEDLARGRAAVEAARAIGASTPREDAYIGAAEAFFAAQRRDDPARDHVRRLEAWKSAQRRLHETYPQDVDAAAFYALALVAHAMTQFSPDVEHDYAQERRAGALLECYLEQHPEHPGLFHYLIHAYDSPALAHRGAEIARRYDQLAPDVPHALHMPSHIFVRLGEWEETAEWNERSAAAALRQPVNGTTSVHYPHALDYMMYAYLQLGDDERALQTLRRVEAIEDVQPLFASAYGIAAARARFVLEQQQWEQAARLDHGVPDALPWQNFPAAEALLHYARGLGAARSSALPQAKLERDRILELVDRLRDDGDAYWATMTEALARSVDAWISYTEGNTEQALSRMQSAADLEDSMDKHPTTPGEVLPARELYGEMLLLEGRAAPALEAFRTSLERTPNRRNAVAGVERATAAMRRAGLEPPPDRQ